MLETNKVVWLEGMFLQPQHLQQQDRYLENLITQQFSIFGPNNWGIAELQINQQLLEMGKFAIDTCKGRLPDGTLFHIPFQDETPNSLEPATNLTNSLVYLAVPLRRVGTAEVSDGNDSNLHRYIIKTCEIQDDNVGFDQPIQIQIGKLSLALLTDEHELGGYSYIAIAKIKEIRNDKKIILDPEYIPACINIYATSKLANYIHEITGLLNNRSETLSQRIVDFAAGRISEINDFLLLNAINRFLPLFNYLGAKTFLHPEAFYQLLLQLIGDLSTFTSSRKPSELPVYQHHDLQNSFAPTMQNLRNLLSLVLERNAIALPLEKRNYGIWVSTIADRELINNATFVLAVNANVPTEKLRSYLPTQIKIAPIEAIQIIISRSLPGIPLEPLPTVPRQIPFNSGFTYFALDRKHNYWKDLQTSSGMAFQISENFPELELEFWAIRG